MGTREDKASEKSTDFHQVMATSQEISAENCYEILTKAKNEGLDSVKEKVYRYMSDHYLQVLRSPAVYGRLSAGERESILALRMSRRRVLAVAEISEGSRDSSRPQSPTARETSQQSRRPQSPTAPETSQQSRRPQSPTAPETSQQSRRVFCLHQERNEWEVLTILPEEIPAKGAGICTMYNYIFVAGGISTQGDGSSKASALVFCYNPLTSLWSQIRPLSQPRSQLKLVSMDGYLYAIGGECLFTVERYVPRTDRWSPVAMLPKGSFAVAHEATSCNGDLFVSGGSLFYRLLRYDSSRDEWEECPFNESRRRSTDMVSHRSLIYRFDVDREHATVSVFKYNTVVKVWHGSMSFPLDNPLPFRCAVLGERIYCVNRSQTLQFEVGKDQEGFLPEVLPAPAEARGALVPFILNLSEMGTEN